MSILGHNSSRILLGTIVLLTVPVLAFPSQFGADLGRPNILYLLIELGYYGTLMFLFDRRAEIPRVGALAVACLGYRVVLGAVFGLVVSLIYSLDMTVSFKLGVYGYLPVIVLQAAGTPFVLRLLLEQHLVARPASRRGQRDVPGKEPAPVTNSIAISREKGIVSESLSASITPEPELRHGSPAIESITLPAQSELNGFERAARYIGEHGSVYLAAVVDNEGLLLANFKRGNLIPEDWAPLALVLWEQNRRSLEKLRLGDPEKVNVLFHEKRLVIAHDTHFAVLVLAERQSDDTLTIRINQCIEMVRRYMAERYSQSKAETNPERIHVSHSK